MLARRPDCAEKIRQEFNKHISDPEAVKHEDLSKLEYLQAFISEVLRFYSPAPFLFPKVAVKDM